MVPVGDHDLRTSKLPISRREKFCLFGYLGY